ncbi:MAG TPA: alpha/beta fold hydrolase [Pseudonocardiaceae bacterium]|nr:alpha/beta fold hydrolase [Pseudonocardiaceae bacterium]
MTDDASSANSPVDPFADLDAFIALPRVEGLRLAPDGRSIVVGMSTLDRKKTKYTTALWELDPDGERQARRLTRSADGESAVAFTPSGDLLFVSKRPEPDGDPDDPKRAAGALWLQPADGGDARVVAALAGGVRGVAVARSAGTVVFGSSVLPSAADPAADEQLRKARKDAGVAAILHEEYPIRFWDHDLGPGRTRLFTAATTATADRLELRDLTGNVGSALHDEASWEITPDGRTVVTTWTVAEPAGSRRVTLVAIDVETGERRALADDPDHEYGSPTVSPDGQTVAFHVQHRSGPQDPGDRWLAVVPTAGGEIRAVTSAWDRWPASAHWTPDGATLVVTADDQGRRPLWLVDVATGEPTRLTQDDGAYINVQVAPDGQWVYALRTAVDSPPTPVRVALDGSSPAQPLRGPADAVPMSGRLTEVTTEAEDGTPLRAWLALPHDARADQPAPMLLWIHGGPLSSWNSWTWRWNPWLAVAKGYAVLLPDPALSTGYGIDFIQRGWGTWGAEPFTDLMSVTDAAVARDDIDANRVAAMGGSFGGYMANWVAGHTDRFAAIVTHASLWSLEQMRGTTDASFYWAREMTEDMTERNSPHLFADNISTPMLVIHGDRDYRVPIGEALRLWWDLLSRSKAQDGSCPHKFLYFPDENHWIMTPNHAKVWYDTVFAFLEHNVLGQEWRRPDMLG